jgi:hypothetical protein
MFQQFLVSLELDGLASCADRVLSHLELSGRTDNVTMSWLDEVCAFLCSKDGDSVPEPDGPPELSSSSGRCLKIGDSTPERTPESDGPPELNFNQDPVQEETSSSSLYPKGLCRTGVADAIGAQKEQPTAMTDDKQPRFKWSIQANEDYLDPQCGRVTDLNQQALDREHAANVERFKDSGGAAHQAGKQEVHEGLKARLNILRRSPTSFQNDPVLESEAVKLHADDSGKNGIFGWRGGVFRGDALGKAAEAVAQRSQAVQKKYAAPLAQINENELLEKLNGLKQIN